GRREGQLVGVDPVPLALRPAATSRLWPEEEADTGEDGSHERVMRELEERAARCRGRPGRARRDGASAGGHRAGCRVDAVAVVWSRRAPCDRDRLVSDMAARATPACAYAVIHAIAERAAWLGANSVAVSTR